MGRQEGWADWKGNTHRGGFCIPSKQEIVLNFFLYGWERGKGRKGALNHIKKLRGLKPELFTVNFLVSRWGRLWFEYTESVRGGEGGLNEGDSRWRQ